MEPLFEDEEDSVELELLAAEDEADVLLELVPLLLCWGPGP